MSRSRVTLVAITLALIQGCKIEASGLVEMISDYAKVVKNTDKLTTQAANNNSVLTSKPPQTTTEATFDYEDFDDLQEEEDRSLKQTSTETVMKYFNGLVSLLALMYKFNGSFAGMKSSKAHFSSQNEPRDNIAKEVNKLQENGKKFHVAQERFEFPQKKFRYQENTNDNTIDQQFQPIQNYPPYNPLKTNSAETYNQDDKKTSYDADLMQYDLTKNSLDDYNNVNIQQSYSYEIPYESSKPVKAASYDLANDDSTSWKNHNDHPVYNSWMGENPTKDNNLYQIWNTKTPSKEKPSQEEDSYKPWKTKVSETKPPTGDSESRQPWHEKPLDFSMYHHEFKDPLPADHHFEYHEIEHQMDEDRVSKKPYSYYFLGRKLWYIPLLFSVYFIIYIGALVLKSVARHKIQFPEKIWNLHDDEFGHGKHRRHRKIDDITENYENALQKMNNKFM